MDCCVMARLANAEVGGAVVPSAVCSVVVGVKAVC